MFGELKSFHPLKSGRDRFQTDSCGLIGGVSIPSSRVGTFANSRGKSGVGWFPSPQVGSGPPILRRFASCNAVSIPSSRVGTESSAGDGNAKVWFPSPQVGSGPESFADQVGRILSFHPLKSGRDRLHAVGQPHNRRVSIPSSRVGTFYYVFTELTLYCFHPLKSGRNIAICSRAF